MERLIHMSTTAEQRAWQEWREERTATVTAPYGPLSLTGTHWLADHPGGRIPGVPGVWREDGDEVVLSASADESRGAGAPAADALTVDGEPLTGEARLGADQGAVTDARVADGGRRLVVLRREGDWAVRDFDPESEARRTFPGIEASAHDPRWTVPGRFVPYGSGTRTVQVANADGRERGLGLGGELSFALDGAEHTLQVSVEADGSLWAVFADATSGEGSFRFRFLRPGVPAADGSVTVDLNRAVLPPCAFAAHFICPFPPPGNTLEVPVEAGERRLKQS